MRILPSRKLQLGKYIHTHLLGTNATPTHLMCILLNLSQHDFSVHEIHVYTDR